MFEAFALFVRCYTLVNLLGTQNFPPFGTAARNGLSTMPGGHPFAEPHLIFSFPSMRLIGTLHYVFLPSLSMLSEQKAGTVIVDPAFAK